MGDDAVHPLVSLMRRFCVNWLSRADPSVYEKIIDPDYSILIGGHTLAVWDSEYVPGTMAQLRRM